MEQLVKQVLHAYGLYPVEIQRVSSHLYKVNTGARYVAVKQLSSKKRGMREWMQVYQMANDYHLPQIIPVYMTRNNELYTSISDHYYYVTPWIHTLETEEPQYPVDIFYESIGEIHSRTITSTSVKEDHRESAVEQQKEQMELWQQELEHWVEQFERRHYMAPIELQVCTHFRDVMKTLSLTNTWYDRWLEDIQVDKKVRQSLCHGNLRPSHFIYDANQPYFINWESAHMNHPITDLASYFKRMIRYHDAPVESLVSTFSTYEDKLSLLNSERSLFALHLLDPEPYLNQVRAYAEGHDKRTHAFQVQSLERSYFALKHALSIQENLQQAREYVQDQRENN